MTGPGYRVHYFTGYSPHHRAQRIKKVYPTVSAACKARDRIFKRSHVTSAYLVSVLRNGIEFCALSNRYARAK